MGAFLSSEPGPETQAEDVSSATTDVSSQPIDVSGEVADVSSQAITADAREEKLRRLVITEPSRNNVSIFACCSTPVTLPKVPTVVEPPESVTSTAEVNSALLTVVEPRPESVIPDRSQEQGDETQNPAASNDPVVAEQDPSASAAEQKSKSESS